MNVPRSSTRNHTIQKARGIYMKRKHLKTRHFDVAAISASDAEGDLASIDLMIITQVGDDQPIDFRKGKEERTEKTLVVWSLSKQTGVKVVNRVNFPPTREPIQMIH
jgi:hypothetical protein